MRGEYCLIRKKGGGLVSISITNGKLEFLSGSKEIFSSLKFGDGKLTVDRDREMYSFRYYNDRTSMDWDILNQEPDAKVRWGERQSQQ